METLLQKANPALPDHKTHKHCTSQIVADGQALAQASESLKY